MCPDSVIDSVCKQSKFVEYPGDLDDIFGLHPDLWPTFYKIIVEVLQNSPSEPKRRRCATDRITETLTNLFLCSVFNHVQ